MFSVSLRLNSTEEERTVLQASKQQQNLCSSFYNVLEGNTIEFRLKSYLYEKKNIFSVLNQHFRYTFWDI